MIIWEYLRKYKKYLLFINSEIFQVVFLLYLIIILTESFYKGLISDIININWVLIIVIITGVILIYFEEDSKEFEFSNKGGEKLKWYNYVLIIFLGILSGLLVYLKVKDVSNWLAIIISILSALIIILISFLIYIDDGEEEKK